MKFPLSAFEKFCSELVIESKESGQMKLGKGLGTQRYVIQEIVKGLEEDIHFYDILKSRQLGITTITLALDLFWCYLYPGMQATLAADSEDNVNMFRSTLVMYHQGLPRSHRVKMVANNRSFMSFANRSRMFLQIGGGSKKKGGKGRGKGITYIHATETASWEDEESLASILASLAEKNPQRLAVFESTARGYNLRHEMWRSAQESTTKKAIFVGWWLNEMYRKERDTPEYRVYWDGQLTPEEREWARAVKLLYGHEMEPEQIAWWRWKLREVIIDEKLMLQEYPPTERHAFQLSGKNFFSIESLEEIEKKIDAAEPPSYYRYKFGDDFMDMVVEETLENMAQLKVWEEPDPNGYYSIGADPAFGSSNWKDGFAIQVYRCYADRFEQVAEFCTTELTTYRFAWVLCSLAGLYRNSSVNLEINGPGEAVQNEINNLRRKAASIPSGGEGTSLQDVLGGLKYYLYRRLDSPTGGTGAYHTLTTNKMKWRMMGGFNDLIARGHAVIWSEDLIEEAKSVVIDEGSIEAPGREKDDRVIASALAAVQYIERMQITLHQMGVTWAAERARRAKRNETGEDQGADNTALGRNIRGYLQVIGMRK